MFRLLPCICISPSGSLHDGAAPPIVGADRGPTCSTITGKRRWAAFSVGETILSSLFSRRHQQLCLFLGVSLPRLAGYNRPVLPLFAKHTHTYKHIHRGECCRVFFFLLLLLSSRANPEPGPGLPLRCSLAHKHKTAFIILPVAAQGLASKSYWFLSFLSPLYKGRAFCKLLARFRPTKGTFIETSLPPTAPSVSSRHLILLKFDYKAWKTEGKKREEEIRKPHRWRVHSALWMALYGLPLYTWQSKDASAARLKEELDKIIGLAAFLHDWHGELW